MLFGTDYCATARLFFRYIDFVQLLGCNISINQTDFSLLHPLLYQSSKHIVAIFSNTNQ